MLLRWTTLLCALALPCLLSAAELEAIPADELQGISQRLFEETGKLDSPVWRLDADLSKANGMHVPQKLGVLIIPPKDLKENDELEAKLNRPEGATLGFLYLYHLTPVVEGKPVASDKLAQVTLSGQDGTEHRVHVALLTGREVNPGEYRLYLHGKDGKPLLEAKFSEQEKAGPSPIAVEINDPNEITKQGKLVLTVFEKYQAMFDAAYVGE